MEEEEEEPVEVKTIVVDGIEVVEVVQEKKPMTRFQKLMQQYKERIKKEREDMVKLRADMDQEQMAERR